MPHHWMLNHCWSKCQSFRLSWLGRYRAAEQVQRIDWLTYVFVSVNTTRPWLCKWCCCPYICTNLELNTWHKQKTYLAISQELKNIQVSKFITHEKLLRSGLGNQKLNILYTLSDSDFAGCSGTARSASGNVILMNGVWKCNSNEWGSNLMVLCCCCQTICLKQNTLAKVSVKVQYLSTIMFHLQCWQAEPACIESTIVRVDSGLDCALAIGHDFTHKTAKQVTVKVRFLQEYAQHKFLHLAPITRLSVHITWYQNIADIWDITPFNICEHIITYDWKVKGHLCHAK